MKDWDWGLILICAVLAMAILGGAKTAKPLLNNNSTIPSPSERQLTQAEIEYNLSQTQYKVDQLQRELAA
jgi:hypothetical protein